MKDALTIRAAREADAPELLSIYEPYVLGTAITFEMDVPSAAEFAGRIAKTLAQYPYLVALGEGEILGYAYASAFKERAAYEWAVETSVYVRMGARGRGVGAALYRALEEVLSGMNVLNLNACITCPNPQSIGFHEKFGYKTVAHFTKCGYKLGAWHDIVWMEKLIGAHRAPPEPVVPFARIRESRGF
jgi:L-amino acid N-acyltransferase YncA